MRRVKNRFPEEAGFFSFWGVYIYLFKFILYLRLGQRKKHVSGGALEGQAQ